MSDDENDRLKRFSMPELRRRFLATRGITRSILGNTLSVAPQEIRFFPAPQGKPEVVFPKLDHPFCFSLSHTGDILMLAFGHAHDIGMDVETVRQGYDAGPIIRRFFSAAEAEEWAQLPADDRVHGFFRAWTRKEAILKATGLGISGLNQFEVSFAQTDRRALRRREGHPEAPKTWWFADFEPVYGYQACVTAPFVFAPPPILRWEKDVR